MLKKNKIAIEKNRGQVLLIATMLFLAISLAVIFGVARPLATHLRASSNYVASMQGYQTAETLNDDAFYRLNKGLTLPSTLTLALNGATSTAVVTDNGNYKEIVSEGVSNNITRSIRSILFKGVGVAFNYGVQVGQGGFEMANNAGVNGNVYANGNITGGFVTGSAVAANSAALTEDQINNSPTTPPNSINFRNATASQDFAQSFQVSTTSPINKVRFYIRKVGSPATASIMLMTDNNGSPSTTNLLTTNGTLNNNQVTTNFGWVEVVLPSNPELDEGETYWLVIKNTGTSASAYYTIGANTAYSNGVAKVGLLGGTWNNTSPSGLDGYFSVYLGGLTSTINDVDIGGDAWAHTISGGSITGTKYCQTGTGCNTTRPDPTPEGFPISDANIEEWKELAEDGGTISGNYAPTSSASTLGPKKITGNMILPGGHTLTLSGAVWVEGTITMSNNNIVRLVSSYGGNSGILISDGRISLDNNVDFYGSGVSGSNILLLTTSACPNDTGCSGNDALEISNNAGATGNNIIFNAQKGTLHFANNAGAKEATANLIRMSNNAVVTYESGLANVNFSSGPGGAWSVQSWKEIAE